MGKGMKIPMTYHIAEGVEDGKMIKLEAKDADSNVSKEELPIFNNNLPQEHCLILLEELFAIADCYSWFTTIDGNKISNKSTQFFKSGLPGQEAKVYQQGIWRRCF